MMACRLCAGAYEGAYGRCPACGAVSSRAQAAKLAIIELRIEAALEAMRGWGSWPIDPVRARRHFDRASTLYAMAER